MKKIDIIRIKQEVVGSLDYLNCKEFTSGEIAGKFLINEIGTLDREHFVVVGLNAKLQPTFFNVCHIGSIDKIDLSLREIFKGAILANSHGIIVAHNHVSGSLNPSIEDILATDKIKDVGDILGIRLIDHIIVTRSKYFSFREKNLIKDKE